MNDSINYFSIKESCNVITLGQIKSDNIKRMSEESDWMFSLNLCGLNTIRIKYVNGFRTQGLPIENHLHSSVNITKKMIKKFKIRN